MPFITDIGLFWFALQFQFYLEHLQIRYTSLTIEPILFSELPLSGIGIYDLGFYTTNKQSEIFFAKNNLFPF